MPSARDDYAAIVLAGGQARRFAGAAKPDLRLGDRSLVQRVLAAVPDAVPRVVVGRAAAPGAIRTIEDPPGAGPAYAIGWGLRFVPPGVPLVAVLAADLPFLTASAVAALRDAVGDGDGAVLVSGDGRRQWLCGVWRRRFLAERTRRVRPGTAMWRMVADATIAEPQVRQDGPPPWFDCDTPEALDRARGLAAGTGEPGEPG